MGPQDPYGAFDRECRADRRRTYPLRQNKVRYSEPPAPLFRERYIRIVERVRDGRKDIAEFLEGTYKDNDIDLTPLDHMGPRTIGLEKRGVVTAVGIENARRIWSDEFRHAEKLAWSEYWKETGPVLQVFGSAKRDDYASDVWKSFIDLRKKISDRRLQAELARITVRMMRSRADAVIRTLAPEPGRPVVPQKGDPNGCQSDFCCHDRCGAAFAPRTDPADESPALQARRRCALVRDRESWSVPCRRTHRAVRPMEGAGVAMRTGVGS